MPADVCTETDVCRHFCYGKKQRNKVRCRCQNQKVICADRIRVLTLSQKREDENDGLFIK